MGDHDAPRRAAWRLVRAVIGSQKDGVTGAVVSGLLWQVGAVAAPLIIKYAIDHGILTGDHHALRIWLGVLLSLFVTIEARFATHPLVPLRIFRSRTLSGANLVALLLGLSIGGIVGYMLPMFWMRMAIKSNRKAIERGMADALDLMVAHAK